MTDTPQSSNERLSTLVFDFEMAVRDAAHESANTQDRLTVVKARSELMDAIEALLPKSAHETAVVPPKVVHAICHAACGDCVMQTDPTRPPCDVSNCTVMQAVHALRFPVKPERETATECAGCAKLDKELTQALEERDRAQDALQDTHIALGGDGEWKGRLPPQDPPESGDLNLDVPELARIKIAQMTDIIDGGMSTGEPQS